MFHILTPNPSIDRTVIVPALNPGTRHQAGEAYLLGGGKGVNVARALHLWGAEVRLYAPVGGTAGALFHTLLESEGIPHTLIDIEGETRINVKVGDETSGKVTEINEAGPSMSVEEQRALVRAACQDLQAGDWLILSGSLPPGVSPALYLACLNEAKRRGARVAVDTGGEALRALLNAVSAETAPDVVKPNAEELGTWMGGRAPREGFSWLRRPGAVRGALERLKACGVAYPFVSLGAAGGAAWVEKGALRARAPELRAYNTVGCGDIFLAAVVFALEKEGPARALRQAVALASEKASRRDPYPPDWADGEAYLNRVVLEAI